VNTHEAVVELRWFFAESDGELGLRAMSLEPGTGGGDPVRAEERQREAYERWKAVNARLCAVGGTIARMLRAAYDSRERWPGLERWYEDAGVATLIMSEESDVGRQEACRRVAKLGTARANELRSRSKKSRVAALRAFVEAK